MTLLGDNSIFNRAQLAKDKNNLSNLEENFKFSYYAAISDYYKETSRNPSITSLFNEELNKIYEGATVSLPEGIEDTIKNTNFLIEIDGKTYIFENGKIINEDSEEIGIAFSKLYNNVEEMKADTALEAGKRVKTKGYYLESLGGSAYYNITNSNEGFNNATDVTLDNGLYAKLYTADGSITVNQCGAYGDGIHDDSNTIKNAINSGYGIVKFEGERYKCNKNVCIGTSNVQIEGRDSTIFYDDEYSGIYTHFISINSNLYDGTDLNSEAIENISIRNLKIENLIQQAEAEGEYKCKVQMRVYNVSNLTLDKVEFTVPEVEGNKTRKCQNLWIYSGWKDITIKNCKFINKTNASSETPTMTITSWDFDKQSENLLFENNYVEKSGHDELIAIFNGKMKNITIKGNTFIENDVKVDNATDMLFSVGYGEEKYGEQIENVQYLNNTINANCKRGAFSYACESSNQENCLIKDNTINMTLLNQSSTNRYFVFTTVQCESNSICLKNNTISITEEMENDIFRFSNDYTTLENNNITLNGKIKRAFNFAESINIRENTFNINSECQEFTKNLKDSEIRNNTINMKKWIGESLICNNYERTGKLDVCGNTFNLSSDDTWQQYKKSLFLFSQVAINDKEINIEDNQFNTTDQTINQLIINLCTINPDANTEIIFKNNNCGLFKKINYWNSNDKILVNCNGTIYSGSVNIN